MVADYSNYGVGLDVVAPGSKVASLIPDGNTVYMDGTSMASPHVAAVAGILKSLNPKLTPTQIEQILRKSAEPLAFENPNDWFDFEEDEDGEKMEPEFQLTSAQSLDTEKSVFHARSLS